MMSDNVLEHPVKYLMEEYPECFSLLYTLSYQLSGYDEICRSISFSNVENIIDGYGTVCMHININVNSKFKELDNLDILQKDNYGLLFSDGYQKEQLHLNISSMTIDKIHPESTSSDTICDYDFSYILKCKTSEFPRQRFDMTRYKDFGKKETVESINNRYEILDI